MTDERYTVSVTRQAEKDIRQLRGLADRATRAISRLEREPYAGHTLSGSLRGARALEFSMPGGAYRAVYVLREQQRECLVFIVGPHEGIYERAERRAWRYL